MQTRQQYNYFKLAWHNNTPIDIEVANQAAWGLPVPDELFLTEEEIKKWQQKITMTLP